MRKIYTFLLTLSVVMVSSFSLHAQKLFSDINEKSAPANAKRYIKPEKFRLMSLDKETMKTFLWSLPSEKQILAHRNSAPVMELPMPNGEMAKFHVWESSIQEPGLEAKFPEIKTFAGQGIDDPYATIRFDYSPYFGFRAQILSSVTGRIYIDPYDWGNADYCMSYYHADNHRITKFNCLTPDVAGRFDGEPPISSAGPCRGTELRTYRLAISCTGEYSQAVAGGLAGPTHAAVVTSTNRITGVYEVELAIRMVLIANNNLIEYLDGNTDPFVNVISGALLNSNQTNTDLVIGTGNYDIGHIFTSDDNGLAGLGVVCNSGNKARGATGAQVLTGDGYDIDYVAHEMGHQFGAPHTFNSNQCASAGGSYEPGGGTTIMAYAGICAANENIQPNSDAIFHAQSFDAISNFLQAAGGTCGVPTPTLNNIPVITSMGSNNLSIPPGTPFTLSATATDPDGDAISYNWEGWDAGAAGTWISAGTSTTRPLFRTRVSKTVGSRTFPDPRVIAANYPGLAAPSVMDGLRGEVLPSIARPMKFRLTVRDNRAAGGGVVSGGDGCGTFNGIFQVTTVGTTPFAVTVPNGGESYAGNTTQTVTWNNAATNAAPFNVTDVKITLSTDGGLTFPTVLLASTPNDGSEAVSLPNTPTTTARIRAEAIGNIFFDISNANWTITLATSGYSFNTSTAATVTCGGATSATVALGTTATGGFSTPIVLSATSGVPAGTTITFTPNPLTPGSSTNVTLNNTNTLAPGTYTVNISGVAGAVTQNTSVSFIVSPGTAPTITTQPTPQTVCAGTNATFTAVASGTVTYQWQVSTGGPFTNIAGATSASYTVTAPTTAQNGNQYHVVVSTICASTTSSNVTLTVNSGPAITTQPSNVTTCSGQNATFTVVATGGGLTYQWQSAPSCAGPWTDIPAANAASYTATAVTNGMDGFGYRVVISGACPSPVTSNCASLTVGNSASITTQPTNSIVCAGTNTSFTVVTTGSVTYQWQVSTGGPFTDIPGATGATLNLPAVTAAMNGNQYHVVVFNCTGTNIVSNNVTLTVNTPIAISTQPSSSTLCIGANASFTVVAAGSGVTYQWQSATSCAGTFTNIAGATAATLTVNSVTAAMSGTAYHVVVTSPCGTVTSSCVTLTVNTPVSITTQPVSTSVCLPATNVSFSVTAVGTGLTYQWQESTNGGTSFSNIAGATGATLNLTPAAVMNGNQYHVVLSGVCTPNLVSNNVTLTVNSPVTITRQPVGLTPCAGDDAIFSVAATSSSPQFITYQWQVSVNGSPFTNITGATNDTLIVPGSVTAQSTGNVYHVIVSGPPCGSVTSNNASLSVNQRPGVVLAASEYSSITPFVRTSLYTTVSPVGTYTYDWYRDGVLLPNLHTSAIPVDVDGLGEYTVQVTDVNTGCGRLSNAVTIRDSASAAGVVFIYPNPSRGTFQVRYYSAVNAPTTHMITVYDSKGARAYQKSYPVSRVYDMMEVVMNGASAGIYLVELRDATGKRLASSRVIVQ